MTKPFVIGIAGGSGAGKTSLTEGLISLIHAKTTVLHLDNYFINPNDMPIYAGMTNWDDPRSVDWRSLESDIQALIKIGKPRDFIVVEGFMLLHYPELRKLLDLMIFLKAPHEIINKRRVHEASDFYRENVIKPMYAKYVLPSAKYANHVIDVSRATQGEVLVTVASLLGPHLSRMRNYLITGIAGTGKSRVSNELAKKGYRVIEFDGFPEEGIVFRKYRDRFDRRTGERSTYERGSGWNELQHVQWKVDRDMVLTDLLGPHDAIQFIAGYADNWAEFKDDFDGIFLLRANSETIKERLLTRTSGDWGRRHPEEMKHALETAESFNSSVRGLGAISIDAERPVDEIVDAIIKAVNRKL